jgi:hypothetical protein
MAFDVTMAFNKRMHHFSKLTTQKAVIEIVIEGCAKYYHEPSSIIFDKMRFFQTNFWNNF